MSSFFNKNKKLFLVIAIWWVVIVGANYVIYAQDVLYDSGGWEGSFWWSTLLISAPFVWAKEIFQDFLPFVSDVIALPLEYVLATLFMVMIYWPISKFIKLFKRKKKN